MFSKKTNHRRRRPKPPLSSSDKANRILNVLLVAFLLILFRVWHLSVIQHEKKLEEAIRPRSREVVESAMRGTIRDRFNISLAINKIGYQAAIYYSHLKNIPTISWKLDANGKKIKHFARKEYISRLSDMLANELELDKERLEDLIHSKSAFYYNIPYVIKEELTEKEYYRLKMMEKDYPGLHVSRRPRRHYPLGKVGSDIIGFMGSINKNEYDSLLNEMHTLKEYLEEVAIGNDPELPGKMKSDEEVAHRLEVLESRAYTSNDVIGKSGIEGWFEEDLRGFQGRRVFASDAKGNFLKELPTSKDPQAGQRILLTLSAELQEYAEQLLLQNEEIREAQQREIHPPPHPWIRGGAIVAMDPNTGEVLALASNPRFDPNDFIPAGTKEVDRIKQNNIHRWFEDSSYVADIWDQKRPLEKERFDVNQGVYFEEACTLTWNEYLNRILPQNSDVRNAFSKIPSLKEAVRFQNAFEKLLELSGQENAYFLFNVLYHLEPHIPSRHKMTTRQRQETLHLMQKDQALFAKLKSELDFYVQDILHNSEKVLLIDLCRLCVKNTFSDKLLESIGHESLSDHRNAESYLATLKTALKEMSKEHFHEYHFKPWRKLNEKEFLKKIRIEEKLNHSYAKPYIDYLDKEENRQFLAFWEKRWPELLQVFLLGVRHYKEDPFEEELYTWYQEIEDGAHEAIFWKEPYNKLKNKLLTIPLVYHEEYLRCLRSYSDLTRPLLGHYFHLRSSSQNQREMDLATAFYPRYGYGYGRSQAFRQATPQGSIFKLVVAYASLMQMYNKEMEVDGKVGHLNPLEIIDRFEKTPNGMIVSYQIDGKPIYQSYKGGRLTKSLTREIGKIDLVRAIETSSNPYFSLLAADFLSSPEDLVRATRDFSYGAKTGIELMGEYAGFIPNDLEVNKTGLYSFAIGQHTFVVTPLQTAVMVSALVNGGGVLIPRIVGLKAGAMSMHSEKNTVFPNPLHVKRSLSMPDEVYQLISQGMKRMTTHICEHRLENLLKLYKNQKEAPLALVELKDELIGKTGTAECVERIHMGKEGTKKLNHIWFGGCSYFENEPELVVIVYLKYGGHGRDAAPVAALIVKKWREILARNPI